MKRLFSMLLLLLCAPSAVVVAAPLETATVERISLPREFRLDGVVEAINRSTISAQTSGQVMEILVDVDDFVEQGSLIIRLKDTEQRSRLDQAEADLKAANAQLQEARRDYERTREIFQRKLVAQSAMDKATAALQAAKARQEAATAALARATEQLEYTRLRAPYSGIVTERLVEVGETASPGQRLISGISLEELRVAVDVPQSLVTAIRQQGEARVRLPDEREVQTESITVFPFADPASGTFQVRLLLPRGVEGLFPGMLVKSLFVIGRQPVLVIPSASIVHRSEVTAVYVQDANGRLSMRHIQTGHRRQGDLISVLAGLEPGEQVVLDPVAAGSQLKMQTNGRPDE